jgi:hypothetical protein
MTERVRVAPPPAPTYHLLMTRRARFQTPDEIAALSNAQYEEYVRELVREGEKSAAERVYSTDEVLAHLAEARRGRARRVGT